MIEEFESTFARFNEFVNKVEIGPLVLNQWEITYIDSFPQGEYWETPADWSEFLPGLFGSLFQTDGLGLVLEYRGVECSYEIEPKRGRLHVIAGPGRWGDETQHCLLLQMAARGPVGKGGVESLRAGLDLGHHVAVGAFLRMVDQDT